MAAVEITPVHAYRRPPIIGAEGVRDTVQQIINEVSAEGAPAVRRWSRRIDGFEPQVIELQPFEDYNLAPQLASAITTAWQRIRAFSAAQRRQLHDHSGTEAAGWFASTWLPLTGIGAYIPGGRFPLISTALMTLVPAEQAACPVRIACSPSVDPALLAAASLAGATGFVRVGGAQAIAAMAYGALEGPAVDMIVGPGNAYVNAAKAAVQERVKIDALAGPSELLVWADGMQHPEWVVLDAMAQAEHDPNAVSLIVGSSRAVLDAWLHCAAKEPGAMALCQSGQIRLLQARDRSEAIDFINAQAPEHLLVCDENAPLDALHNYGSLFIGENSAVAFGDYCAGPNHTLPTAGCARFSGGLSVAQCMKLVTAQKISAAGRRLLAPVASALAAAEGLENHRRSVLIRDTDD